MSEVRQSDRPTGRDTYARPIYFFMLIKGHCRSIYRVSCISTVRKWHRQTRQFHTNILIMFFFLSVAGSAGDSDAEVCPTNGFGMPRQLIPFIR